MNDAYPLPSFRIQSTATLCDVMRAYPLATLVSGAAGKASITLVPLLVEDADADADRVILSGHMDRNNPQAGAIQVGAALSFQFLGPDS